MVPSESQIGEKNLTLGSVQRAIQKGMSAAAVAEALGFPNIVTTDEQGREVYAVPGKISSHTSAGTNELIKDGAKLIQSVDEPVWETGRETASQSRFYLAAG